MNIFSAWDQSEQLPSGFPRYISIAHDQRFLNPSSVAGGATCHERAVNFEMLFSDMKERNANMQNQFHEKYSNSKSTKDETVVSAE